MTKDVRVALEQTAEILRGLSSEPTWVIPQSGGKDSRTTAQAALHLIKTGEIKPPERMVFPMADTLMEYELFISQAERGLEELRQATEDMGIEAHAFVTHPIPQDDFWVRIIGYGFVPPTTVQRWCTDKLKIAPIRKILQRMGWADAPVLLGVRWGESQRRDDVLSCKAGGECGPDFQYHIMRKGSKRRRERAIAPIIHWELCAVWDWLTLHAAIDGFDNNALVDVYGPTGKMRYGCWSCPLIFNDTTGEFLAQSDKKILGMIQFTKSNFRPGGAAWRSENRELIGKEGGVKDGRLSLAYRRRLYDWLIDFEVEYGVALLHPWQKLAIQAVLSWFEKLPDIQRGYQPVEMFPNLGTARRAPRHISEVVVPTALALSRLPLRVDRYHERIAFDAASLASVGADECFYLGQSASGMTHWESVDGNLINVKRGKIYT